MPLYEYACPHCGRFELIRKFSDPELGLCPTCGRAVEKLVSAPAFQFKGTGWYVTDYARKSSEGGNSKGDGAKDGGGAKGESAKGDGAKSDSSKSEAGKSGEAASAAPAAASTGSTATGGGSQ